MIISPIFSLSRLEFYSSTFTFQSDSSISVYVQTLESNVIETTQPSKFTVDPSLGVSVKGLSANEKIVDCHLSDFDADSSLDMIIVIKSGDVYRMRLYWGNRNSLGLFLSMS